MRHPISMAIMLVMLLAGSALAQTPTITNLIPTHVAAGSSSFSLGVNGSNFYPDYVFGSVTVRGARVQWRRVGSETIITLPTTWSDATKVAATVAADLIGTPGTVEVRVVNLDWGDPPPASSWVPFSITGPLTITTTSPLPPGILGEPYSLNLNAAGGVLPYVSWSVVQGGLPPGLSLNSDTGQITGTPTETGVYVFLVRLMDASEHSTTKQFSLTINLEGPLTILTNSPVPTGEAGVHYSLELNAAGGIPPYTWVERYIPFELDLDLEGNVLSGTPSQAGTFDITFRVYDQTETYVDKTFSLTINPPLTISTTSPLPDATVGNLYSAFIGASDGLPPYRWSMAQGAPPPGIVLLVSGELRGTPRVAGTYDFTIRATDALDATASREFSLTVNPAGPEITTTPPLLDGTVGTPYSVQLAASGGTEPYEWTIGQGSLPPGISLSPSGSINGTPTAAGEYPFLVTVTDDEGQSDQAVFTITVNLSQLQITTMPPLPDGTVGTPYSVQLAASGGTEPYEWSIGQGALPPGLSLDSSSGVVSGTPTAAGEYQFLVIVADGEGGSDQAVFTITVNLTQLQIETTSPLPDGTVGTAYSPQDFAASGGSPPYSWTVVSGQLPVGLTLDSSGLLSGTPASAGTFGFTVQVTDAENSSAQREFTISVQAVLGASIEGLPDETGPAQQPQFGVALTSPYPTTLTGRVTLTFAPDAAVPVDDPSVQFSTGGRVVQFTVPAGEIDAVFPVEGTAVQAGTVAGAIVLSVQLFSGETDVTPSPQPTRQLLIARSAPVITSVRMTRTASGFEVRVVGLSTPREVTQATFRFNPAAQANLQTTQLTPTVGTAFTNWYQSETSASFGSAFEYVQTFSVQGDINAIGSVNVTLSNPQGTSQTSTASF